jgi:hypothetical protein
MTIGTSRLDRAAVIACLGVAVATIGCRSREGGNLPVAPTAFQPGQPRTSLALACPAAAGNPGEVARFSATATGIDGTSQDVTDAAEWRTSNPAILVMESAGRAKAVAYGSAMVYAVFGGLSASMTVRVRPPEAYLLEGFVMSYAESLLPGSTVELTSSLGAFKTTTADGRFALPAHGDATARVIVDGKTVVTRPVAVSAEDTFYLLVPRAGAGAATGTYDMTFTPSSSCRGYSQTAYRVDVEEWQGTLSVRAQGDRFLTYSGLAGFDGARSGDGVSFTISAFLFDAICFIDNYVGYKGVATGSIEGDRLNAVLKGAIGECTAVDHRLEMVRIHVPEP